MKNLMVWLTINRNCNLHCGWCYQGDVAQNNNTMTYRLSEELIDISSGLGAANVILIGGEPTLHPRFFDIIGYIRNRGLKASLVSNSIKFSDKAFVNQAKEAGLQAVTTSIKGSSGEEYLASTGKDVFCLVKTALQNLKDSGIISQVSVTVSESVIANWEGMIRFIKENGINNLIFSFEKPTILSDGISFDEKMLPVNISKFIQEVMYPSLLQTGAKFKIELIFQQCVLNNGFVEELEDKEHAFGGCLLLKHDSRVVFDPQGFVLPCNHFLMHPLGKYGEDFKSPREFIAWRQSEKVRRFYQVTEAAPGEKCAQCGRWSKCGAGCRIYWLYAGQDKLMPV